MRILNNFRKFDEKDHLLMESNVQIITTW